jgi:hypothetical protein
MSLRVLRIEVNLEVLNKELAPIVPNGKSVFPSSSSSIACYFFLPFFLSFSSSLPSS